MPTRTHLSDDQRDAIEFEMNTIVAEEGNMTAAARRLKLSNTAVRNASLGQSGWPTAKAVLDHRRSSMEALLARHESGIRARRSSAPPSHRPLSPDAPPDSVSSFIQELGAASGWSELTMRQVEQFRRGVGNIPLAKLVDLGEWYEAANHEAIALLEVATRKRT